MTLEQGATNRRSPHASSSPRSSLPYRYYVLTEINQMRRAGRKYWSDPWNFWDWANICSFIVMAAARYQAYRGMSTLRAQMAESPDDSYFNFQNVAAYAEMESTATAFSAVLTYLKVLAYLARVPRLNTLLATLGNAGPRLGSYLIILAVIWVAFASAFYLALGTQLDEWRSVRAIRRNSARNSARNSGRNSARHSPTRVPSAALR